MENVRVSENVKLFVEHPYFGQIEIPIDRIEYEEKHYGEFPIIHFTKKRDSEDVGVPMTLYLSLVCIHIGDHVEENNLGAVSRAKERGFNNLDRYIVKDMCIEEILVNDEGVRAYCTWEDFSGGRRMYYSMVHKIKESNLEEGRLYATADRPTFYF